MITNHFNKLRVSIVFGALFLCLNCSSQVPTAWVLRDVQSLDVNVMNTIQWLKIENSNFKFLNKSIKKKLALYKRSKFHLYNKIENEIKNIDKNLKNIESSLKKQKQLARQIRKRPKMKIFDSYEKKKTKRIPFLGKKEKSITIDHKSKKVLKILNSLEKNSSSIIVNQKAYNNSLDDLLAIFSKEKYKLVFIRTEVEGYKYDIKELIFQRAKQNAQFEQLVFKVSDALQANKKSIYTSNILELNQKIENYIKQMDQFEKFVNSLVDIGGKECRGLVYLIKDGQKKKYQEKYENGLQNYKTTLIEIPKLFSSI